MFYFCNINNILDLAKNYCMHIKEKYTEEGM